MKTIFTTLIATLAFAGTATAGDATFKSNFAYDAALPVNITYDNFKSDAKQACAEELVRAGYRPSEAASYQRKKCERQLMKQAVKAAKSKGLLAYHNNGGKLETGVRKFASKK